MPETVDPLRGWRWIRTTTAGTLQTTAGFSASRPAAFVWGLELSIGNVELVYPLASGFRFISFAYYVVFREGGVMLRGRSKHRFRCTPAPPDYLCKLRSYCRQRLLPGSQVETRFLEGPTRV